jgi:hypothetical protein
LADAIRIGSSTLLSTSDYDFATSFAFGHTTIASIGSASVNATSLVIRSVSAMIDLATRPRLAGYELLVLVANSGVAAAAQLVAVRGARTEIFAEFGSVGAASDSAITIPVGKD